MTITPEQRLSDVGAIQLVIPEGKTEQCEPLKHFSATPYVWTDPASIPPRQWLYKRHLIRKFVSMTVAPGGLGKSSLTLVEAIAMATGRPLLGQGVGVPLHVWLWNLEDPRDELVRRIQVICQYYDISHDEFHGRLFIDTGREQELCTAIMGRNGAEIQQSVIDNLVAEMKAKQIDVLIIDPFVSSHAISENDNPAMDAVAKAWGKVADRTGAAISLVHHTRKLSGDVVTVESSRGGKALTDAARDVRALNRMTKEDAIKAGVENHRFYFRVFSDKANLSPPVDDSDWYKIENVALENGDDVGVVIPWKWPDALEGLKPADLRRVQEAIQGRQYRKDPQANDWAGIAIAKVLELDPDIPHDIAKIKICIKTWVQNGAIVVKTVTIRGKTRPILEVGTWV